MHLEHLSQPRELSREALGLNVFQMDFYCLCPPGNELIGNFSVSVRNVKLTLKEMSNFVGNQAVGGLMVMDMSSPGLLHSWSSS